MNPEQRITQLENEVRMLTSMIREMQGVNTVTPEFSQVLARGVVTASGKAASAENQSVNEAGVAVYSVLKPPDGFKTIGGFNFPYYL